ncbi:MAG TPA: STT3 domain-containing protein [Vicinamibacterales bacterium]|nr:STT3 domain-containing protein [Vicinamibacterales bacterium]
MRREYLCILTIAAVGCFVRIYPAWDTVFGGRAINFLETDSWYHLRLIENQVRNFPWRVTLDPYAAAGGQFVPIAPLYDTLTASAVVISHGREATTHQVEWIAAFVPPLLGTLTIIAVWATARRLWDRRAALLAAALLAVLPGHFLDRTMLGFVDHHALEALLAVATLWAVTRALVSSAWIGDALLAGLALGLYLLGWGSGAFLVGILGLWVVILALLARERTELLTAGRLALIAAVVALALVLIFQDSRMHRYASQVIGLIGLAAIGAALWVGGRTALPISKRTMVTGGLVLALLAVGTASVVTPALFGQLVIDLGRLAPDPGRMGVLEARPLFLYSGTWSWAQPWQFFRTGFFIGVIALVPFVWHVWKTRHAGELLVGVYAVATLAATIGQNRFGYYLVTACGLLGGWLAARVLDWGGVPHALNPTPATRTRLPMQRELAVIAVAGGMFAPNLAPALLLMPRSGSLSPYWHDTMTWLRQQTADPFKPTPDGSPDYYLSRYPRDAAVAPSYTVMNWWDQGYWLVQRARRVPVSNPTQERAPNAARFYAATDEAEALRILAAERARFVISDWELPFRIVDGGTVMGRFQNVLDWAGGKHDDYYGIFYRRDGDRWTPVWVFHEPYYRSMAYRLSVMGAARAVPINVTSVLTVADRVDQAGVRFREVLTQQTFATYALAQQAAARLGATAILVGLDPWQSAFPLDALQRIVPLHGVRTPEQAASEAPWVRIFEAR